jgi:hypothetical protein
VAENAIHAGFPLTDQVGFGIEVVAEIAAASPSVKVSAFVEAVTELPMTVSGNVAEVAVAARVAGKAPPSSVTR